MACDQVKLDTVKLFPLSDCGGKPRVVSVSGIVTPVQFASFVIPENFKVRFTKSDKSVLDFNQALWGNSIDDVAMCIDVWKHPVTSVSQHASFENVDSVTIEKLGTRDHLIASSCVGLLDVHVPRYEPFLENKLNPLCTSFLDTYCRECDEYTNEICDKRPMFAPQNQADQDDNWVMMVYFLLAVILVVTLVFFCYPNTSQTRVEASKTSETHANASRASGTSETHANAGKARETSETRANARPRTQSSYYQR